ncbi:hypothetical protein RND71_041706 [Anisodus tanguticus]|uniref:Uncharacterized protein n=1 Tax=Anisodus tanguticus TaxID=243964 RepID=A0AAE1QUM3_9SOLA|nr:hypothetical protein RND71_041706 [Anisodus tanguticus]
MFRPPFPLNRTVALQPLLQPQRPPMEAMENLPSPPPQFAQHHIIYATQPLDPMHQPHFRIELGLQGQAVVFTMTINGVNTVIALQNPNFLAQIISEGMKLAMDNYMNHVWLHNVLNPLAPTVAPAIFHHMQVLWNLAPHFNPFPQANHFPQLPFFTPPQLIQANPLFYPWMPLPVQLLLPPPPQEPIFNPIPPNMQPPNQIPENMPPPNPIPVEVPPVQPQDQEEVDMDEGIQVMPPPRRTLFTEISSLKSAALMLFPAREDKKYTMNCPIALKKCSFDLRPAINSAIAKQAVILLEEGTFAPKGTAWDPGNGMLIKLWDFQWIPDTPPLRSVVHGPLNKLDSEQNLAFLWDGNNWDWSKLSFEIPQEIREKAALALHHGLAMAVTNRLAPIQIETDSTEVI